MNKITELGKFLRIFRKKRGLLFKDMANSLGVSHSFLSLIVYGKREIPKDFVDKMSQAYVMSDEEKEKLLASILLSQKVISLNLFDSSDQMKEVAINMEVNNER